MESELGLEAASNVTAVVLDATRAASNMTSGVVTLGTTSLVGLVEEEEASVLAVIRETVPGLPFLLMSTCVVGALIAALFLEDIKKGMDESAEPKEEEDKVDSSNSQSENSETQIDIKNTSLPDINDFVESSENVKLKLSTESVKATYAA